MITINKGTSKHYKKYKNKIIFILILIYLLFYLIELTSADRYARSFMPKSTQEKELNAIVNEYLDDEYISHFYEVDQSRLKFGVPTEVVTLVWEKNHRFFLMVGTYSLEKNDLIGWTLEVLTPDILISDKSDIENGNIFFKKVVDSIDYTCRYWDDEQLYSCKYTENTDDGMMIYTMNSFDYSFDSIERATKKPLRNIRTEIFYCFINKDYDTGGECLFN